jgi:hypothetical protein
MTNLSPAAQAVLDASNLHSCRDSCQILAAALEAVAEQIMPITPEPAGSKPTAAWHRWNVTGALRLNILSIAAELRAQ